MTGAAPENDLVVPNNPSIRKYHHLRPPAPHVPNPLFRAHTYQAGGACCGALDHCSLSTCRNLYLRCNPAAACLLQHVKNLGKWEGCEYIYILITASLCGGGRLSKSWAAAVCLLRRPPLGVCVWCQSHRLLHPGGKECERWGEFPAGLPVAASLLAASPVARCATRGVLTGSGGAAMRGPRGTR